MSIYPPLVMLDDDVIAWKILACDYGSEGLVPQDNRLCPYYHEHGWDTSCVSSSGDSLCGGFMGSEPGYVYCGWGFRLEDKRVRASPLEEASESS